MILLFVAGFVVLLDQISKAYIRHILVPGESIPIIPGLFSLTHVRNPGAAFGILPNRQIFFLIVTLIVIAVIIYYYQQVHPHEYLVKIAMGMTLGGALGNLIDRTSTGLVTDFLDFHFWPVFNLADSFTFVGFVLIAWGMFRLGVFEEKEPPVASAPTVSGSGNQSSEKK